MPTSAPETGDQLNVANYVVAFIDLLGQRAALRDQGLLHTVSSEIFDQQFLQKIKSSVGSIAVLQERASDMMEAMRAREDSALRQSLPEERRAEWDEGYRPVLKSQNWSDGLMFFTPVADKLARCPTLGVYQILALTGALCFMGLASAKPLRGGIEIAWAMELNQGELYGAALARSYELESEVAGYPRIVVGPELIRYLDVQSLNPGADIYAAINRQMADICRSMLIEDDDGHWIVHYLGSGFRMAVTTESHVELVNRARQFIREQLKEHRSKKNTKLAFRYLHLEQYFSKHPATEA